MNKNTQTVAGERTAARVWKRVLDRRFHYLSVLYQGATVLGFIFEQGPESLFNCNIGCGDSARFIGHKSNSRSAKDAVEEAI